MGGGGGDVDEEDRWGDRYGGSLCRMSTIRNGNVSLLILRKRHIVSP